MDDERPQGDEERDAIGAAGEHDAPALGTTPGEVPPTPTVATTVFGDRLAVAEEYVALLADTGITHGLIGPREAPRLWDRHVLGCGVVAPVFASGSRVADIGSGAGLPGLVIALARPDLEVTLVEPLHRRVVWLESAVDRLELSNVVVHEGRADSLWGVQSFETVTARAVARIGKLAGWCLPLCTLHGRLVALKGERAEEELREDEVEVRAAGGHAWEVEVLGQDLLDPPTRVISVTVGADGAAARRAKKTGPGRGPGRSRKRR